MLRDESLTGMGHLLESESQGGLVLVTKCPEASGVWRSSAGEDVGGV